MSIKLICIDMDGTLLMDESNISDEDKNIIRKAVNAGIHVAITTGRVYNCAHLYSKLIGLNTGIIASNGAFIADAKGNSIYKNPLDIKDVKDFLTITEKYNLLSYLTANFGLISTKELPENNIYRSLNKTLKDEEQIKLITVNSIEEAYNLYPDEILKGVCIGDTDDSNLIKARNELHEINNDLEIVSSWNNNFEVMRKGSSKGEAVEKLTKHLNLNREEVMCIGDSENDVSMIKFAGLGVAMGNAIDVVKNEANYITDTNKHSGVSKAIQKFVLD